MFELCRQDNNFIIDNLKYINIDEAKPCMSTIVDDIILAMFNMGVLKCFDNGFNDKRKPDKIIPIELITTLSVAAKIKCNTSLTDIPCTIQSHKVLSKLGYNLVDKKEAYSDSNVKKTQLMP